MHNDAAYVVYRAYRVSRVHRAYRIHIRLLGVWELRHRVYRIIRVATAVILILHSLD